MLLEMQLLAMIVPDLNTEADLWSLLEYLLRFFLFQKLFSASNPL